MNSALNTKYSTLKQSCQRVPRQARYHWAARARHIVALYVCRPRSTFPLRPSLWRQCPHCRIIRFVTTFLFSSLQLNSRDAKCNEQKLLLPSRLKFMSESSESGALSLSSAAPARHNWFPFSNILIPAYWFPFVVPYLLVCRPRSAFHSAFTTTESSLNVISLLRPQGRSQHGARGAIAPPPPILAVAPPNGSCPGHSRKPAFGNGAIAYWEMYKN